VHHHIGSLLPSIGQPPRYSQIYFYDPQHQLNYRESANTRANRSLLSRLQNVIFPINPYVHIFKSAQELAVNAPNLRMRLIADRSLDLRRYNKPAVDDIAAVIQGEDDAMLASRDIILQNRDSSLMRISETHPVWAPSHYVLFFTHETDGWHLGMQTAMGRNHTALAYHNFHLYVRTPPSPTHLGGRLFQQYLVDCYASIEQSRLRWIRNNQHEIRADVYRGVQDAFQRDTTLRGGAVRHRKILPSSFKGSARQMHQQYHDAMYRTY
jgi:hypothetical protein